MLEMLEGERTDSSTVGLVENKEQEGGSDVD